MPLGAVAKRLGVKGKTLACQRRGFDSLCSHQKRFRKLNRFFSYTLPRTPDSLLPSGCSVEYICRRKPLVQNIEQAYRPHSGVEWHFACSMRSKWRHRAGISALQPPGTPLAMLDDLFKVFRQAFISYFIGLSLLYEHKNNNNRCCSVRFSLQPKVRNGQLH